MVSAASGPYAAELNASSPNIATPVTGPTLWVRSSSDANGRPKRKSRIVLRLTAELAFDFMGRRLHVPECKTFLAQLWASRDRPRVRTIAFDSFWVSYEGVAQGVLSAGCMYLLEDSFPCGFGDMRHFI